MKTKLFLIVLIAGSHFSVVADNDPYHDYLLTAETGVNTEEFSKPNSSDMNVIGSWVEDAQFRFNSSSPANNIDIKKNALSYELRLKPKAWGQRAIEKDIIKLRSNQQDNIYNQLLNVALQKRYFRLLDYFEQGNRLQNLLEAAELLKQKTRLIQSQISSEQFNPEKLLDTEEALKQNQSLVKLYLIRFNTIQSELGLPLDTRGSIEKFAANNWLVNVAEIHQLTSSNIEENQSAPDVLNARLKLQLSQSENQLIKTKQQLGINFLKFEYGDREKDELAFQVGINIPLGRRFNDTEKIHNLYTAQSQLNSSIVKTRQSLTEISREIAWLSEHWQLIDNQVQRQQSHLQKDFAKNNALLMINLRSSIVDNKQKKTEINQKALDLYISYLALSGQLIQHPLRNWIRQGTPVLAHSKTE